MSSLVSVVVTCYNHETYIEQCIESIFNQTEQNIELIVFNDGSTDSSELLITKILKKSPFKITKYISQKNQGLVLTRNKAFDIISGDFLLFVDSDNFLEPNYIEAMLNQAKKQVADIIYTRLVNPEDGSVVNDIIPFDLKTFYKYNFIDSCSLVRVSKIKGVRYDEYLNHKKLEDYDFFWNLILNNDAIPAYTDETHLNYRVIEGSLSARGDIKKHFDAYAHILSKYAYKNKDFVEEALIYNFDLLSIEQVYKNQFISVYFDKGEGFSEDNKTCYPIEREGTLDIKITSQIKAIRIDMTENPIFLEIFTVKDKTSKNSISPCFTNGILVDGGVCFTDIDPMIIYNNSQDRTLTIVYKIFNLSNIFDKDYVAKGLTKTYSSLSKKHRELENKLRLQEELYRDVIHSRRWRYTSKLIDFIRRKT